MPELPQINSPIVDVRIEESTTGLSEQITNGSISTIEQLRVKVFENYINHFRSLSGTLFKPELYQSHSHKDQTVWNKNSHGVARAFNLLFDEGVDLSGSLLGQHNLLTQTAEEVLIKSKTTQAKMDNIRDTLEQQQFFDEGKSIIILSDDFTDNDNVDFSQTVGINVDLSISAVVLATSNNVSRGGAVDSIEVTTNHDVASDATPFEDDGLPTKPQSYEGDRYGFIGDARPQTGVWRIEAKNTRIDKLAPDIERDKYYLNLNSTVFNSSAGILDGSFNLVSTAGERLTPDEYLFDDRAVAATDKAWIGGDSDLYAKTITRQDFEYVETLPTIAQLESSRLKMVDGDPNNFWEIEYTPALSALTTMLNTNSGSYDQYQVLAKNYLANNSSESLDITIKVTLDNSYYLNFLDLIPFFFSSADEANFTVTSLVTQEDETAPVIGIPGFDADFDNTIGTTSNNALSNEQLEQAGIFNRFGFKGRGFWSFPSRKVKIITMTIKQDTALPDPYQVKLVQLLKNSSYTLTQAKATGSTTTKGFGSKSDNKSGSGNLLERGRTTQLVQFGYLETVLAELDAANTGLLSGTTAGSSINLSAATASDDRFSKGTGGIFTSVSGALMPAITAAAASNISAPTTGAPIVMSGPGNATATTAIGVATVAAGRTLDKLFTEAGGSSSSDDNSKAYNDSGFQVNHESKRTLWGRGRYAIGIRELGMYARTYVEAGVITSKPYQVLAGDKNLTLEVDHKTPISFTDYNESYPWIKYYVIINNQEVEIRPEKMPPPELPHSEFPSLISLASFGDEKTLISIRFKAVIMRPSEAKLLNSDSLTPLLNKWKIIIEQA